MRKLGLGACLADDMGLGKTVQVIALLNSLRSSREEKVLLIIPASLIGNWTAEINRFAPGLNYRLIHPQEKNSSAEPGEVKAGIYITTYGMLGRTGWLQEVPWDIVILDEAQAIKNPGTKQTKSVKQLKAYCRIALTGTPVENRLADLWSIFDFLNQGLLGNAREFSGFAKKLKDQPDGYGRLKQVVSPFILRRLKSDKNIIADLPEKIEMKSYATLSKKQAALYMSLVKDLQRKLESSDGIERKGLVLASLMKFKQICNHPDQYLGQDAYLANESGKYDRLREICETIYAKRERVIVFTQFREITKHLADFLQTVFHHEGLVLHGQTPVAKRKDIVAKFQGPEYVPFMILSIKAGGVGLNLTAANHVIHFDRWWNPAVENQATDRAFRIGQNKNVLVHKFITRGTIEERIDLMIEEKIKMTQEIIPDLNEAWITELDNQQLLDLFRLAI
jgi:non-specific serine/threonine protein kinase